MVHKHRDRNLSDIAYWYWSAQSVVRPPFNEILEALYWGQLGQVDIILDTLRFQVIVLVHLEASFVTDDGACFLLVSFGPVRSTELINVDAWCPDLNRTSRWELWNDAWRKKDSSSQSLKQIRLLSGQSVQHLWSCSWITDIPVCIIAKVGLDDIDIAFDVKPRVEDRKVPVCFLSRLILRVPSAVLCSTTVHHPNWVAILDQIKWEWNSRSLLCLWCWLFRLFCWLFLLVFDLLRCRHFDSVVRAIICFGSFFSICSHCCTIIGIIVCLSPSISTIIRAIICSISGFTIVGRVLSWRLWCCWLWCWFWSDLWLWD